MRTIQFFSRCTRRVGAYRDALADCSDVVCRPILTDEGSLLPAFLHEPSDLVLIDISACPKDLLTLVERFIALPLYYMPLVIVLHEGGMAPNSALCERIQRLSERFPALQFLSLSTPVDVFVTEVLLLGNRIQNSPSLTSALLEHRAAEILLSMNIQPHLQGYYALKEVIRLVALTVSGTRLSMMKEIYPAAARACGISPITAERAMRHVIDLSWSRSNLQTIRHYFGCGADLRARPTNSAFIYILAERLRSNILSPLADNSRGEPY